MQALFAVNSLVVSYKSYFKTFPIGSYVKFVRDYPMIIHAKFCFK